MKVGWGGKEKDTMCIERKNKKKKCYNLMQSREESRALF